MTSPPSTTREGFVHFLESILDGWDHLARGAIIALMTVMVSVVATQVLLRYVFNSSIGWADEVSRLTFVWTVFLAIPLGIRAGVHLGIDLLAARLPIALQVGLVRAIAATSSALMLLVCYESTVIAYDQWDERMASVNLSAGWFVLAVALGSAHAALHLIRILITGSKTDPVLEEAEGVE